MSSLSAVLPHLERRFESQRLVFWHDPDGEYAAELDALDLSGVTTLRVENNEYAVKNRVLHGEPSAKFLLYRGAPVPPGTGNWLLDLELAYGVFTADRTALVSQDLGLSGSGIDEVVLAMNATLEGQTTAHYIAERLETFPVRITQLAHGLPVGGELDYLDEGTLAQALRARRPVG